MNVDFIKLCSFLGVSCFAYDWIRKNFYFADNILQRVSVCNEVGELCTIILGGGDNNTTKTLADPRSIVLSPTEG